MADRDDESRADPHLGLSRLPHDPDLGPEAEEPSLPIEPRGWPELTLLAAVGLGGFGGTLGRYELDRVWPTPAGHFPAVTFTINTTGAFLLGALLTILLVQPFGHRQWRAFLGTGVLGGWTTYSALAVEGAILVKGNHVATAAGYLGASLAAGLAAVGLGIALGRAVTGRPALLARSRLLVEPDEEPA